MDLHLSKEELSTMSPAEQNCSKQISVVNDIYSWEKELLASQHGHKEGSALCSAVQVLAGSAGINIEAAKRVLWAMAREWEREHDAMYNTAISEGCSASVRAYIKGLEYQMSGNELWSRTTLRYRTSN
jgi:aristolochene synthase